jgi:predicted RNase H-like nuclease (RuvC/YqgF family)
MTVTEEDVKRIVRGPADLEEQIDQLKKKVEFLQGKCRQAGQAILDLGLQKSSLSKELDRLAEENSNLRIILKGNQNGKEK